jgi:drug/metabolite transporter (DMT)-like permease
MVIPISAGVFLYNETFDLQKAAGLVLALPAVILTGMKTNGKNETAMHSGLLVLILPVMLFFGAGLVDTSIKFAEHHVMNAQNMFLVVSMIFFFAGFFGLVKVGLDSLKKTDLQLSKSVPAGMLLGVINFLSLYYLLKCLTFPDSESSIVFAIINIGVVVLSFVSGMVLFKEKPNQLKSIGILLAVAAIVVLSY